VDYGNGQNAAPTEGHLVYPYFAKPWVEQTMYQIGSGTSNLPKAPHPPAKFTSASISIPHTGSNTLRNILNTFVVAAYPGGPANPSMTLTPTVVGQPDSWIPYASLGTSGLPAPVNGSSVISPVGLLANLNGSFAQLNLAAVGTDGQLYVASFLPSATPNPFTLLPTFTTNFSGVSWASAGAPPAGISAATPSIGSSTLGRYDYFVLGNDGQFWTRWAAGGVWQSGWMQIPNTPAFQSGPSVAAAFSNVVLAGVGNYGLVGVGTDGQAWMTWMGSMPTLNSYGGNWIPWFTIGGIFTSGVTIAGWNRGFDIYGVGTDNNLYHDSMDNDFWFSGWFQLEPGGIYANNLPYGPTAANRSPDTHQVDLVTTVVGTAPVIFRYPW
jgi:hypothetical protein